MADRTDNGGPAMRQEIARFLDAERVGVLATTGTTGRPRQSVVYYVRDGERLLVSTEAKRLKARDVARTGWASLCVLGHAPPFPSAVFSGPAELRTENIGRPTAAILQRITGAAEPPEPQSDAALAAVDRIVLAITIEVVSAVSYMEVAA